MQKVSFTITHQNGEKMELEVELPQSLEEALDLYESEVIFYHFLIGAKTSARNAAYSAAHVDVSKMTPEESEKAISKLPPPAEIAEMLEGWQPKVGTERGGVSPETLIRKIKAAPPEKRAELISKLQAQLDELKA